MTPAKDILDKVGAKSVGRQYTLIPASTIEAKSVAWMWTDAGQGRLPAGSLSVAAGREGTGKSSFGLWLAAGITQGSLPGIHHGTPGGVIYLAAEDSWEHTLIPRLMVAKADLGRVFRMDVIEGDDDLALSLPVDNELLEDAIASEGVRLVIIDPLLSYIGEGIDTHKSREVRKGLDPLVRIAQKTGAVILGIAHFNKGSGSDPASLITGSGAFKDVPRSVFGFAKGSDESGNTRRVMSQVKNSLGLAELPSLNYDIASVEVDGLDGTYARFTFTGESDVTVQDLIDDQPTGKERRQAQQGARDWLEPYLREQGPTPSADVIAAGEAQGHSKYLINKASTSLGVLKPRSGYQGGSTWELPESNDAPPPF
ncbi:AAA family ATPase [Frankia tisae]|uniref:AAA family ATPase n=1 Tax=Frankia tisae TaxID=2950104 RepID=UPI0021C00564|nr:AAA family ATPase [Frankia tisae]